MSFPSGILASEVSGRLAFLSTFGAHTWGVSFWVGCLGWVLPLPLVSCVAGSALLVFALCTHCALFNGCHQVFRSLCWRFSEFACSPWAGCLPFPFFSGLFCFVFSLSRVLGFAVPLWRCLPGFSLPPWPSFHGRFCCL